MDGERNDLIIRTLRLADTARLVKMDREISGRSRQTWYEQKVRRALLETDVNISLGAELDGTLVGAMLASVHYGEFGQPDPVAILDTLLVDRAFSRRGVASALLEQLLKNLGALRIARLRTEVGWNEVELLSFFSRVGFMPAPRLVLELDVAEARLPEREGPDGV